jgi:putative SOS response-associated peptidase YedK
MPASCPLRRSRECSARPDRCRTSSLPGTWRRRTMRRSCGFIRKLANAASRWRNGPGAFFTFTKDLAKARKPINGRCETVARSPLFKEAFARRRCLVPAAAYYEWRHDPSGKTPFAVSRRDGEPVALGGMWEGVAVGWRDAPHFRHADHGRQPLSLIQERMPVIIERADWKIWLGEGDGDVTALLSPLSPDRLRVWPVARTVNSVKNDGPELLEPHSVDIDEPVLV